VESPFDTVYAIVLISALYPNCEVGIKSDCSLLGIRLTQKSGRCDKQSHRECWREVSSGNEPQNVAGRAAARFGKA
jgi:hypothetical protein